MENKKELKEDILITNGDFDLLKKSLEENKIVLAAVEMGDNVTKALATGHSEMLNANVQMKESTSEGICFCKKPATHLIYIWR